MSNMSLSEEREERKESYRPSVLFGGRLRCYGTSLLLISCVFTVTSLSSYDKEEEKGETKSITSHCGSVVFSVPNTGRFHQCVGTKWQQVPIADVPFHGFDIGQECQNPRGILASCSSNETCVGRYQRLHTFWACVQVDLIGAAGCHFRDFDVDGRQYRTTA